MTRLAGWHSGAVALWRCGCGAVALWLWLWLWRCGAVALWRCGAVAVALWRCGAVAVALWLWRVKRTLHKERPDEYLSKTR